MTGLLKKGSRGEFVILMQEMLKKLGYEIATDGIFGRGTEKIVMDFQQKYNLKIDGLVGSKTWILLADEASKIKKAANPVVVNQFLSESDFKAFSKKFQIDIAAIKAVHEVESNGRGFLNGKIKILFEGHIFWRELNNRGIDPNPLVKGNEDILYKKYFSPNPFYKKDQHQRLEKAKTIHEEAALCSASYGLFQIMGFHYKSMKYKTAKEFVEFLSVNEANQLLIFGQFLDVNNLLKPLRNKSWATFARGYNGSAYKTNRYDTKLARAFKKYSKI